jgi:hypothetical protein
MHARRRSPLSLSRPKAAGGLISAALPPCCQRRASPYTASGGLAQASHGLSRTRPDDLLQLLLLSTLSLTRRAIPM